MIIFWLIGQLIQFALIISAIWFVLWVIGSALDCVRLLLVFLLKPFAFLGKLIPSDEAIGHFIWWGIAGFYGLLTLYGVIMFCSDFFSS